MERARLGAVPPREDGHVPTGIPQFPGKLFHHRRLARAPHGQVADGNDLHSDGRVPQNAHIVKKAPQFDGQTEQFRARQQEPAGEPGAPVVALLEDDFEHERFQSLGPDPQPLSHGPPICQSAARVASSPRCLTRWGLTVPSGAAR